MYVHGAVITKIIVIKSWQQLQCMYGVYLPFKNIEVVDSLKVNFRTKWSIGCGDNGTTASFIIFVDFIYVYIMYYCWLDCIPKYYIYIYYIDQTQSSMLPTPNPPSVIMLAG